MTTLEQAARAIYAVSPNGGMIRTPSTATNQFGHTVYDKVFEADPWEDAPDRHENSMKEARAVIQVLIDDMDEEIKAGKIAVANSMVEQGGDGPEIVWAVKAFPKGVKAMLSTVLEESER